MSISDSVTADDVAQIFLDCGQNAAITEIVRSYDPQTGREDRLSFSHPVSVVLLSQQARQTSATAVCDSWVQRGMLLRRTEVPPTISLTAAQLVLEGRKYEIRSVVESSMTGVLLLDCVSDSLAAH
jgi:hypothetical protein